MVFVRLDARCSMLTFKKRLGYTLDDLSQWGIDFVIAVVRSAIVRDQALIRVVAASLRDAEFHVSERRGYVMVRNFVSRRDTAT
ncbi:hypothetical protein Q31b_30730 [Novipirellula aureliae]|uniref:Uncharacterized protein n=1 Tax=Novipirellula aureliae TaxID=2527966 RepID=A0A5C6DY56_9BACT|nr:hypothetical protein Q31b_30730 [Novipirellula aureliae]